MNNIHYLCTDMSRLIDHIADFLVENGFELSFQIRHDFDVIVTRTLDGRHTKVILPLEISAGTIEEAEAESENAEYAIRMITREAGYPLIITEDRWRSQRQMMEARLLAHLELFSQAYARNCEVRRIEKAEAQEFLNAHHSYGYAACRYHYGLFLKRHTGHTRNDIPAGTLIAVATFSNARKWVKGEKTVRSYEWTRYASLPEVRVNGGMGKLLKAFIKDILPDDIMSYADLEWSDGEVYSTLGFIKESMKEPVMFAVDGNWKRTPISRCPQHEGSLYLQNLGSLKYRLKLYI